MNKYFSKLFGIMFQSQQTQQVVRASLQHLPTSPEEWHQYWQTKGFPWRTEPEIDVKRQEVLNKRRAIVPDIEKGIYPFKGMELSRADVEWLLAMHENGRGPVDWKDENQREREGLDLRGADLSGSEGHIVNLRGLPLARLRGSTDGFGPTEDQATAAMIKMDGVFLRDAHLEGAILSGITLKDVFLRNAHLQEANLSKSKLLNVKMRNARLAGANLSSIHLENSYVPSAQFMDADLSDAQLIDVDMDFSQFDRAHLTGTRLERVSLRQANFGNASLKGAIFKDINLEEAQFQGANLRGAQLEAVRLRDVILSDKQHIGPALADMQWERTNLTVIDWSQVKILADEDEARQKNGSDGGIIYPKSQDVRIREYRAAVRANRQLAIALQDQGLNEDAARFAYRAQVLQRKVLWKQRNFWKWLGSAILALLAGYGYRMWRIIAAYMLIVLFCAGAYFVLGIYYGPHLSFPEALLTSITAFHGRVFSEPFLHPYEPQLGVTAFEAVMGLVIEGVFIAMLTQKFFGK